MRPLPLSEKLLIADGIWGRENQLSLRVWLLAGRSCFSGWTYTHENMDSTTGTPWTVGEKGEVMEYKKVGVDLEE